MPIDGTGAEKQGKSEVHVDSDHQKAYKKWKKEILEPALANLLRDRELVSADRLKEAEAARDGSRKKQEEFEQARRNHKARKHPERREAFITTSSQKVDRLYTPLDTAHIDFPQDISYPGEFPYRFARNPTHLSPDDLHA